MSLIEIDHVTRLFDDPKRGSAVKALDDVSVHVARNEFLCLLGPSGCGKSTLLNLIAGFDMPSSGSVRVGGQTITAPGADRGVVFQQPTLMPWLTVWENVAFHLTMQGVGKEIRRKKAQHYIEMVNLKGFENHYPSELSGGMNQRVGIARALLMNPEVILMDEPFGALDNQTRVLMQELLLGIWEAEQKTVLFVTHDIDEAIFMANRVAVFSARPGRIKADIPVNLPHPRHYTVKTSPEFMELKARLTEEIRAESLAAAAH